MAKRRKEEALETRERILKAAVTVFHERGLARPSLTEVAELAGVTRGAVYGHFRNKADLFSALTERVQLPGEELEVAGSERSEDPLGALRGRWLMLYREVAANREWRMILEIIFHRCELVTESGEILERMLQCQCEGVERIRDSLSEAARRGQLPADLNIELAAPMLHSSLIGVLENWLLRSQGYDLVVAGERYLEALLDMLRLSPALRLQRDPVAETAETSSSV